MNKKRKNVALILTTILVFTLCSCKKSIENEYTGVENEYIESVETFTSASQDNTITVHFESKSEDIATLDLNSAEENNIVNKVEEKIGTLTLNKSKEEKTLETAKETINNVVNSEEKDADSGLRVLGYTSCKTNFRNLPLADAEIISVVPISTVIYFLDNMELENDFYHVMIGDTLGYIYKENITASMQKLYAKEDTYVKINGESTAVKKGDYFELFELSDGSYKINDDSENVVSEIEGLVSYKDYIKSVINEEKLELLTSFSTNYSLAKIYEGKAFNIDHCCTNYINGIIVQKGDVFNWFKDIGDTGEKEGYTLANVFSGGKVIKGYGGGVCQVSSTMYNCVLNLDLEVIERHAHGKPVYYVDYYAGKDASVSDTTGDFNFVWRNTTDFDIYIKAYTSIDESQSIDKKGVVTIEFYKINL